MGASEMPSLSDEVSWSGHRSCRACGYAHDAEHDFPSSMKPALSLAALVAVTLAACDAKAPIVALFRRVGPRWRQAARGTAGRGQQRPCLCRAPRPAPASAAVRVAILVRAAAAAGRRPTRTTPHRRSIPNTAHRSRNRRRSRCPGHRRRCWSRCRHRRPTPTRDGPAATGSGTSAGSGRRVAGRSRRGRSTTGFRRTTSIAANASSSSTGSGHRPTCRSVPPPPTLTIALAVVGVGVGIGIALERPPVGPEGVFVPPPPGSRHGLIVPAPIGTAPAVMTGAPPIIEPGMRVTNKVTNINRVTNNIDKTTIVNNHNTTVVNNITNVTIEAPPSSTANHQAVNVSVPAQAHLAAALPPVAHTRPVEPVRAEVPSQPPGPARAQKTSHRPHRASRLRSPPRRTSRRTRLRRPSCAIPTMNESTPSRSIARERRPRACENCPIRVLRHCRSRNRSQRRQSLRRRRRLGRSRFL